MRLLTEIPTTGNVQLEPIWCGLLAVVVPVLIMARYMLVDGWDTLELTKLTKNIPIPVQEDSVKREHCHTDFFEMFGNYVSYQYLHIVIYLLWFVLWFAMIHNSTWQTISVVHEIAVKTRAIILH